MSLLNSIRLRATAVALILASLGALAEDSRVPTLSISLDKTVYMRGEPLVATVRATNKSSQNIKCGYQDNDVFAHIFPADFVILRADGVRCASIRIGPDGYIRPPRLRSDLAAGASLQCDKVLMPQYPRPLRKGELLEPGHYKLKVEGFWRIPDEQRSVAHPESEPVPFEICEPTGVNAEAAELIANPLIRAFLTGGIETHGLDAEGLEELLEKYPASIYASHARIQSFLRQTYGGKATIRDRAEREGRRSELPALAETGNALIQECPAPLRDNILRRVAQIQDVLSREFEAMATYKRLIAEYPDGDARPAAEEALAELEDAYQRYLERQAEKGAEEKNANP